MYGKADIFNLALNALLLTKQINDADNDPSREATILRLNWKPAVAKTLEDLDLNKTKIVRALELIEADPNDFWSYAYKYPSNCAFFRRIRSQVIKDTRSTKIPLEIGTLPSGVAAVYTDEAEAYGEYIPSDFNTAILSASAGLALGNMLAYLCTSLLTGKAAPKTRQEIMMNYRLFKAEAQELDANENTNYDTDEEMSEFVSERMS